MRSYWLPSCLLKGLNAPVPPASGRPLYRPTRRGAQPTERQALLLLLTLAAGCAKKANTPEAIGLSTQRNTVLATSELLPSTLLAHLPEGSYGPYLQQRKDRVIAVFANPTPQNTLQWYSLVLDAYGTPQSPAPHELAITPSSLLSVSLKPLSNDGYVLLWSRRSEPNTALEACALNGDGILKGSASTLLQTSEPFLWADAVPTAQGAHIYLATRHTSSAKIQVVFIDNNAKPFQSPILITSSARAWQALPTAQGSLLASVIAPENLAATPQNLEATRGLVAVYALKGPPSAAHIAYPFQPSLLTSTPTASFDLDAVATKEGAVLAWTDHQGLEARIHFAALDTQGVALSSPHPLLISAGEQALIGITGPTANGNLLVAWDDPALRLSPLRRRIMLSSIRKDLHTTQGSAILDTGMRDERPPLFASTRNGFVALTLAPACYQKAASCVDARVLPSYAYFDSNLVVQGSAPLLPQALQGVAPTLAWGLTCTSATCFALAAGESAPGATTVHITDISPHASPWRPIAVHKDASLPRAIASESISLGPRFSDIATATLRDRIVYASITEQTEGTPPPPLPSDIDPRAEAEKDRTLRAKASRIQTGRSAIVSVRVLDRQGTPLIPSTTISVRALTTGGLALAPSIDQKDACLAWTARDEGNPQIFLTRIGPDGRKQKQSVLTHSSKETADVAIAPLEDGWLVAWVDTRSGNGEVYAAKVDHDLHRKSPEQRITNAPGDASSPALLVHEREALLAFSDARNDPKSGMGDAFVARLNLADASKVGDEVRLAATPQHARGLRLITIGNDTLAAWIDQPSVTDTEQKSTLQIARLRDTSLQASPVTISWPGATHLASFNLTCENPERCYGLVMQSDGLGLSLQAFLWDSRRPEISPHELMPLFAPAGAYVASAMFKDWFLITDSNGASEAEGRIRKITMQWE